VRVDKLYYRFPVGKNLKIQIDAVNGEFYNGLVSPITPFSSDALGAVSRFGRFNPVFRSGNPSGTTGGGAGITFAYKFNDKFRLEAGFLSSTGSNNPAIGTGSNDPTGKNGLFNGSYAAIAQIVANPIKGLELGLTYAHSYYPGAVVNLLASTGSALASSPFGAVATDSDTIAGEVQYRFSPRIIVGGWAGATFANRVSNNNDATILNWAAFVGFPDLGKKGNLGGILFGMPPKVIDASNGVPTNSLATSLQLEAFYRYRVNDNIAITPGFFVIFNPEHNNANDTQVVGTLRTTFTF
jgi:hypothetical protein